MKYVIIGCSATGLAAAKEIRRADKKAEITIVTDEAEPFYFRSYLIDLAIGKVDYDQILNRAEKLIAQFDLEVLTDHKVVSIDTMGNFVRFTEGDNLYYDYLLVATGRMATWGLLKPFRDLAYLLQDFLSVRELSGKLRESQRVIICGGGLFALELVFALQHLDVTFITDEFHFWHTPIGGVSREQVEGMLSEANQDILMVKDIQDVTPKGEESVILTTDEGLTFETDVIISAYPRKPAVRFLRGSNIDIDFGVLVSRELRSNIPNIFAAGDVAEMIDGEEHRFNYGWRSAARQGEVVGRNMVADHQEDSSLLSVPLNDAFFYDFVGGEPLKRRIEQ
jgi:nitrite reductase (NADH) large subunit